MQCYVYRSRRKQGSFLFVPDRDDFSRIPEVLMKIFGEPEFSFDFDLTPDRQLVMKAEASEVLRVMRENGFFLQLPPSEEQSAD
ncbi:MAG: YcgL domain-containing protein [Gammaproteobacteria bacterium]|nr:YcgL domain-containing protein [Gammaproteobacteria bacterium]MBU1725398.1 YcgL domain-containing protein [Gammaproteobacteria bacterium]MBU2005268.1 YcgL domain-containing protein [Gammaproteobacteria bacterium]